MQRKALIRKLKDVLQKRRAALRKTLANDLSRLGTGAGIDIGDNADIAVDDEHDLLSSQLAATESRELRQIDKALERILRGRYGVCEGCGSDIPLARLQALPYATRCVTCQREAERQPAESLDRMDWSMLAESREDEEESDNTFADHIVDVR